MSWSAFDKSCDNIKESYSLNYHPSLYKSKYADINIVKSDNYGSKMDIEGETKKDKLDVKTYPTANNGLVMLDYFVTLCVSNLLWYCSQYKKSNDQYKKMFNAKNLNILNSYDYALGSYSKLLEINNLMIRMKTLILKRFGD